MPHLLFEVKGQLLIRKDTFYPVAKSFNYLKAKFDFLTDDWDGLSPVAIFSTDDGLIRKQALLDDNMECFVPNEVLEKAGKIRVSVYGGDLITTNYTVVLINETGYGLAEDDLDPPSPDMYTQLYDYFTESRADVKANKDFVEEKAEMFRHIDGGSFTSEDWGGDPAGDTQTSTIQMRGGAEGDFDSEKVLEREFTVSDSVARIKLVGGQVKTIATEDEIEDVNESIESIINAQSETGENLENTISRVNDLEDFTDRVVANWYIGDDNALYLIDRNGNIVGNGGIQGIGGGGGGAGGGGGSTNYSTFTARNALESRSITVTDDEEHCYLALEWSSIDNDTSEPNGNGTLTVFKKGAQIAVIEVPQGYVEFDVIDNLVSGTNQYTLRITEAEGQYRDITYTVNLVTLYNTSSFSTDSAFNTAFIFDFTPYGAYDKYGYLEIDGVLVATTNKISSSGMRQRITVAAQTHGVHELKFYTKANVNGKEITSQPLVYDIICYEYENPETLIASNYTGESEVQYSVAKIEYRVYNTKSTTCPLRITTTVENTDGEVTTKVTNLNVDRRSHVFDVRFDTVGTTTVTFSSNGSNLVVPITVTKSDIDVEATKEGLSLYLSAIGRSNSETSPNTWLYNEITTDFSGVDWSSTGWVADDSGDVALTLYGDARATVNYLPFATDMTATGGTIEFDIESFRVKDYDAKIIQCLANGRGFYVTPTHMVVNYLGGSVEIPFKENSRHTFAITIEKKITSDTCYRFIRLFIDGGCQGIVQYPVGANFSQGDGAVPITIGSNDCGVRVYKMRIYNMELSTKQVVDNFIADSSSIDDMLERYNRNNIFEEDGRVSLVKLYNNGVPIFIYSTPSELPVKKKDPAIKSSAYFLWPEHPEKSFATVDAKQAVQGTSSENYDVKNWFFTFSNGIKLLSTGETLESFSMRDNSVGITKPCFKADYASHESANNIVLVKAYNDMTPYKTPHQLAENARAEADDTYIAKDIRQTVDGFGMVMFRTTSTDLKQLINNGVRDIDTILNIECTFAGKYNFNNDKGNFDIYGYQPGDEVWEVLVNTGGIALMQDGVMDNWEEDIVTSYDTLGNPVTEKAWTTQIGGHYPKDNTDYTRFKQFVDFVKSTDVVTPNLSNAEKEALGCTAPSLTPEQVTARLQKFHDELPDYVELDAFTFDFLFKDFNLLVDNWAKNAFWCITSDTVNGETVQSKWYDMAYDMDTAAGTDNNGNLKFDYFLEGTDHFVTVPTSSLDPNKTYDIISETIVDGVPMTTLVEWASDPIQNAVDRTNIYNGQDNTLFVNFQNPTYGFMDNVAEMYRGLRASGALTFEKWIKMFTDHQSVWCQNLFNIDGDFKFLEPLYSKGDARHLPKYLGSKESQREYFYYYRMLYEDTRYRAGFGSQFLETRTFAPAVGLNIKMAFTSYAGATWANTGIVQKRVHGGEVAVLPSSLPNAAAGSDNVLQIWNAPLISDLGDLSANMLEYLNASQALGLTRIKVGDADSNYVNNKFNNLTLASVESGNTYDLLTEIDVRNCINYGTGNNNTPTVIDARSCVAIERIYMQGTSLQGVSLPSTGTLEEIYYSASAKQIIIENQPKLTVLSVPNWSGAEMVILRNVGDTAVDMKNLYQELADGTSIALSGFEWTATDAQEIMDWLAAVKAKNFDWLDENNVSTTDKTLSCTIYVDSITGSEISAIRSEWIGVTIRANTASATVRFMDSDNATVLAEVIVTNGEEAVFPVGMPFPQKPSDAKFDYSFEGWSRIQNAESGYDEATIGIYEDTDIYPAYSKTLRKFTVVYMNGNIQLEVDENVVWGSVLDYNGAVPSDISGRPFIGWSENNTDVVEAGYTVTHETVLYAMFLPIHTVRFYNGSRVIQEFTGVEHGSTVTYTAYTPTASTGAPFIGWSADGGTTVLNAAGVADYPIMADTDFYAQFTPVYTVRFFRYAGDAQPIFVAENVVEHTNANYTGTLPTGDYGAAFESWSPSNLDITQDTDCVAVFETLYKVDYYVGNELFYSDEHLHYGSQSTCPNTPTAANKKFVEWIPNPVHVTRNMTVYAQFDDTYSVYYFANDTDSSPLYVDSGLDIGDDSTYVGDLPVGPYGAEFIAWDPVPNNIQGNMYTYATYETLYSINFYNENGSYTYYTCHGVHMNGHPTYEGDTPTKAGFEFVGWTPDGGTTVIPTANIGTYTVTGNTDMYAVFSPLFTVTFRNGSSVLQTNNNVSNGATTSYTGATPVDEEYGGTFLGWKKNNEGNVISDLSNYPITENTNLYAAFSTAYVVTFYSDENTVWEVVKGVAPSGTATPTKGNPSKTGYAFDGWDGALTNVNSNFNTYAVWTPVYTVRYIVDSTAVQSSTTVRAGDTYAFTGTTPTKSGYEFTGWSPTPGVVNADVDYVAQWIQLHTVRFMDGATVLQTVNNVRHGADATFTGTYPTKTDYEPNGWLPAPTNITADTDCVLQWVESVDPLEKLYAALDDGTYATKYSVGDEIPIPFEEDTYTGQIVGIDTDVDANDTQIPVTIMFKELLTSTMQMNTTNTNSGGWEASAGRTTVAGYESSLPEGIRLRLVAAKKYSKPYSGSDIVTYDKLWIPSYKELGFTSYQESSGPVYSGLFTNDASRIKRKLGESSGYYYWTRTANTSYTTYFRGVNTSGSNNNLDAGYSYGVAVGFCLGAKPKSAEEIAWDNLAKSIQNNTYTTDYSVGDLIPYTTSDGDTYHAQIVGFNLDEDENGNTIPVSFITKELNTTTYPMNATNTNSGGWEASAMRTSTMPILEDKLPDYIKRRIVPAKKYSKPYSGSDIVTYDKLWIPSYKELGFTSYQESSGPVYSGVFTNDASRIKRKLGESSGYYYWTRTAYTSGTASFRNVNTSGSRYNDYAGDSHGVAVGFCFDR